VPIQLSPLVVLSGFALFHTGWHCLGGGQMGGRKRKRLASKLTSRWFCW